MEYRERYEEWISNPYFDEATREELKKIADDDNEIKERFYKDLRQMALRHMCLTHFAQRRNFPMQ